MSTARILHDARQLIERVGWTQHTESDAQGVCLVGALLVACKAANGFPYDGLAEPLCVLRRLIANSDGEDWSGEPGRAYNELEVWNDAPGRTYVDIVAVLSAAELVACIRHSTATPAMEAGIADHVSSNEDMSG